MAWRSLPLLKFDDSTAGSNACALALNESAATRASRAAAGRGRMITTTYCGATSCAPVARRSAGRELLAVDDRRVGAVEGGHERRVHRLAGHVRVAEAQVGSRAAVVGDGDLQTEVGGGADGGVDAHAA